MSLRSILEKVFEAEKNADPFLSLSYDEWLEEKSEEEKSERKNKNLFEAEKACDPTLSLSYVEWLEVKSEEEKYERKNQRSVKMRKFNAKQMEGKAETCRCFNCQDPDRRNPDVKWNEDGTLRFERFSDRVGRRTSWYGPAKRTDYGYGYRYDATDVPLPYTMVNPYTSCSLKDPENYWSTEILIPLEICYHWDRCFYCQERWPLNPRRTPKVTGNLTLP